MKKYVLLAVMALSCVAVSAQNEVTGSQKFLNRFMKLVERVNIKYADNADSVAIWKFERKNIQVLYKERYKERFTDDEIETYAELNGQYRKKMAEIKLDDLTETMDTIGARFDRGVRRTHRKVSGFLRGMKEKSDMNRSK